MAMRMRSTSAVVAEDMVSGAAGLVGDVRSVGWDLSQELRGLPERPPEYTLSDPGHVAACHGGVIV